MTPIIKRMELAEAALVKNGFQCVGGVWAPAPAAPAASADTLQTFDWGRDGMVPTDDPNSAYCYTRDAIAHTARTVAAERTAKEHAIQQAQQHAMEARTQRGTVLGILRHFDCAEDDWHALELVKVAHENEVQAAIARASAPQQHAQPDLRCVIQWLGNGCDPLEAAKELRAYQKQMGLPDVPVLAVQQHAQAAQYDLSLRQEFLDWNRQQSNPPVVIAYEYGVFDKVAEMIGGNAQAALSDEQRQNAELVHERLKDIRHLYPGSHASALAKEALPCIRAILAASHQPAAAPEDATDAMAMAVRHYDIFDVLPDTALRAVAKSIYRDMRAAAPAQPEVKP